MSADAATYGYCVGGCVDKLELRNVALVLNDDELDSDEEMTTISKIRVVKNDIDVECVVDSCSTPICPSNLRESLGSGYFGGVGAPPWASCYLGSQPRQQPLLIDRFDCTSEALADHKLHEYSALHPGNARTMHEYLRYARISRLSVSLQGVQWLAMPQGHSARPHLMLRFSALGGHILNLAVAFTAPDGSPSSQP
ncbi:hypothetical protein V5O48_002492 [Marasmius crinis-equi]|uniref:Uncharacterized protein n=1 Tax=Marasmius crinis-equi TaxID=585013 RepID=A0ABR3FVY7_9AGAR